MVMVCVRRYSKTHYHIWNKDAPMEDHYCLMTEPGMYCAGGTPDEVQPPDQRVSVPGTWDDFVTAVRNQYNDLKWAGRLPVEANYILNEARNEVARTFGGPRPF